MIDRPMASRASPRDPYGLNREGFKILSGREEQVLSYASAGYLDKQIGQELGVSLNTLRTYWQRIRTKIGEAPRSALATAYVQHVSLASAEQMVREAEQQGPVPAVAISQPEPFQLLIDREPDWEIDLVNDTYTAFTRWPFPVPLTDRKVPIQEILSYFHPEDQSRIRSLIVSARSGELDEFTYSGRVVTSEGVMLASAIVRVIRDEAGHPLSCRGWRTAELSVASTTTDRVIVGNWTRDLQSGTNKFDEGFLAVFRLEAKEGDLRDAAVARFHPDELEAAKRLLADAAAAGRERVRHSSRLKFEDGTEQWVVLCLSIEYEEGRPSTMHGTVIAC